MVPNFLKHGVYLVASNLRGDPNPPSRLPTDFTDLNLYCIKGALASFVLVSFSGYVC